jgi:hypothetical protein
LRATAGGYLALILELDRVDHVNALIASDEQVRTGADTRHHRYLLRHELRWLLRESGNPARQQHPHRQPLPPAHRSCSRDFHSAQRRKVQRRAVWGV